MTDTYKVEKYRSKLRAITDNNPKHDIYRKKLDGYSNRCREEYMNMNRGLKEPSPIVSSGYNLDINSPITINTIGFAAFDSIGTLIRSGFERRSIRDDDVLFEIKFCGICHSDWHSILNEWNDTRYPVIPGHEISGIVLKVGKDVTLFEVGDHVVMGPLYNSCRSCEQCIMNKEQYCLKGSTQVYDTRDRLPSDKESPTGPITYGGFSNIMVVNENYLIKIPSNVDLASVAPLLCAGITTYSPIKNMGIKSGQRLGVAGCGGLGHMCIKIAAKMGIEVVALTRTEWKLQDTLRLKAKKSILSTDNDTMKENSMSLDYIIDTIPFKHDIDPYLDLLKVGGTICVVGAIYDLMYDNTKLIAFNRKICGSLIGGIAETKEMIDFCVRNDILPEIQLIGIDDVMATHKALITSKVKYRYVIDMSTLIKN